MHVTANRNPYILCTSNATFYDKYQYVSHVAFIDNELIGFH